MFIVSKLNLIFFNKYNITVLMLVASYDEYFFLYFTLNGNEASSSNF